MREALNFAIYKIEYELIGNSHLNQLSEIQEAIDKVEITLEKAKRLIK